MSAVLGYVEKVAAAAWRNHYRIPRQAYFLLFITAIGAAALSRTRNWGILWAEWPQVRIVLLFGAVATSLLGIWRWTRDRSRCRGGIVVAIPSQPSGSNEWATQVQHLILRHLRDELPPDLAARVTGIPVVIGGHDRHFAVRLRARLKCAYLVHGDVMNDGQGEYITQLRVLQPAQMPVMHWDTHTRDVTPAFTWRGYYSNRLTPASGVVDAATAPLYARELESVARGIAGQLAARAGNHALAKALLDRAINTAGASESGQIDLLRAHYARLMETEGDWSGALSHIRDRVFDRDSADPELLRTYQKIAFHVVSNPRVPVDEATKDRLQTESIAALRKAVAQDSDPLRDVSLYNLVLALRNVSGTNDPDSSDSEEYQQLLSELVSTSRVYRRQWYVRLLQGWLSWWRSESAAKNGDTERSRQWSKDAAKWYGRALRARPIVRFFITAPDGLTYPWRFFQTSAVLVANLFDAHHRAGHSKRARWYGFRVDRIRYRRMRTAERAAIRGDWQRAYSYFDWAIVGNDDIFDVQVKALAQLTAAISGRGESADVPWQEWPSEAGPIAADAIAHALVRWGIDNSESAAQAGDLG